MVSEYLAESLPRAKDRLIDVRLQDRPLLEFLKSKSELLLYIHRNLVDILLGVSELSEPSKVDIKALRSKIQKLINSSEYRQWRQKLINLSRFSKNERRSVAMLDFIRFPGSFDKQASAFLESVEDLARSGNDTELRELPESTYGVVRSLNTTVDRLQEFLAEITEQLGGGDSLIDNAGAILKRSPWFSGSFYLTCFAVVIVLISISQRIVAGWSFPLVLAAGIVSTTLIGALQLRNDDRLSEIGLLTLIELSFKQIF